MDKAIINDEIAGSNPASALKKSRENLAAFEWKKYKIGYFNFVIQKIN